MPISYSPTFQHAEWIDNVDRVQAGGDNGFNIRFNAIETEFQNLSRVMQVVDAALGTLGQQVLAPVTLNVSPMLLPLPPSTPWEAVSFHMDVVGKQQGTFVANPPGKSDAWGSMLIAPPEGVKLVSFRVLGEHEKAGTFAATLWQEERASPYDRTALVVVSAPGTAATPATPIPNTPTVDGGKYVYYLEAKLTSASATTAVRLRAFQVTYQP